MGGESLRKIYEMKYDGESDPKEKNILESPTDVPFKTGALEIKSAIYSIIIQFNRGNWTAFKDSIRKWNKESRRTLLKS